MRKNRFDPTSTSSAKYLPMTKIICDNSNLEKVKPNISSGSENDSFILENKIPNVLIESHNSYKLSLNENYKKQKQNEAIQSLLSTKKVFLYSC